MDFKLTEEQLLFQRSVRDFALKEIAPVAEEMDETGEFRYDLVRKLGDLGVFGIPFPEEYGGAGGDTLTYAIAMEEIARVDGTTACIVSGQVSLDCSSIYYFGTEEQKQKWLGPLIRGELISAFGLTEPGAGSDAGGIVTTAVLDGDEWVINGSKCFISNSGTEMTGYVLVVAATETTSEGKKRFSCIIVPNGTPGFIVGKKYNKMGWRAMDTRELIFRDCRVPRENLLGKEGEGLKQALRTLDFGRISVAALALGQAQGCLDMALTYAREREQFGQPIRNFQAIQFKLAEMATKVELARLMTYKAAWLRDEGLPFSKEAAMAKYYAGEVANEVAHQSLQVHGGHGFMGEYPIARFYRDVRVLQIAEGTSEICRIVIARNLYS